MRNRIHILISISSLVVVDDLNIVGVTLARLETDPLWTVHADALWRTQVAQRLSDVQRKQQVQRSAEVQAPEPVRSLAEPNLLARCVAPRPDHGKNILHETAK